MRSDLGRRALATAAASALLGGLIAVALPSVAAAADCAQPDEPMEVIPDTPWAQNVLQAEHVWTLSRGDGVTVAVLDSGVQADHPKLEGQVKPGRAWIDKTEQAAGSDDATVDCIGHGTAVAGLIAGKDTSDNPFSGVAPDAKILPVRISSSDPTADLTKEEEESTRDPYMNPQRIAEAIRWAADQKVGVMNLSFKYSEDHAAVRDAIAYAVAKDVLVIAAGGNHNYDPVLRTKPVYPANYPGVLGVGAVDPFLIRTELSQEGEWIDLVGPGENIIAPNFDGHYQITWATSMATAFVSGTAALVRSYRPDWTAEQVADQLMRTASAVGGDMITRPNYVYGYGMVDPVMALTEHMPTDAEPAAIEPMDRITLGEEYIAAKNHEDRIHTIAVIGGTVGAAAFFGTLLGVAAIRRGKRSKWKIRRADRDGVIEPMDDGDPISLYQGVKGIVR